MNNISLDLPETTSNIFFNTRKGRFTRNAFDIWRIYELREKFLQYNIDASQ